jgi:acyl-CoA dehydrogenase
MNGSMIADSAEKLFSTLIDKELLEAFDRSVFPEALWTQVDQSGFPAALASEASGGIGLGWVECFPILYGVGYWQVPLPLADTMIANYLISAAGGALPGGRVAIADGPVEIAIGDDGRMSGKLVDVSWARHCQNVLIETDGVDGGGGRLAVVSLVQPGVRLQQYENHAAEPLDSIALECAQIHLLSPVPVTSTPGLLRTFGALACSAMLCGALDSCLRQAVVYANDRVQFGRPLAKYQAIQQQLALLAGEISAARTATLVAFSASEATLAFDTAVAKVRASEAATLAANICHQVHGAIGFTHEHSLHFSTRRLWAWRGRHGSDAYWAGRLGQLAIDAGSKDFWERFTDRFDAMMPIAA